MVGWGEQRDLEEGRGKGMSFLRPFFPFPFLLLLFFFIL